jgi:hypothetical protein
MSAALEWPVEPVSVHRAAAARRARIRALLRGRTQDEPILQAADILRLLGDPTLRLRTVERDLRAIRNLSRGDTFQHPASRY